MSIVNSNNLFTSVSNQIASNMVRKANLTPYAKDNEDADRDFVMNNASARFDGTTIAVIGTGFQIGAPAKSVSKNAPLSEWIIESLFPNLTPSQVQGMVSELVIRHAKTVQQEAMGVPCVTGGSEQIKRLWSNRTSGIAGAETVLEPIGSTPKAPNSSVVGDAATVLVADGATHMGGNMTDEMFAALEAAYKAAAAARGAKAVKVAKPRTPKVKSSTTVVKGSGVNATQP